MAARACPRCNGVVHPVEVDGVHLGGCESCAGVWAEEGRLLQVLFRMPEDQARLLDDVERGRTGKQRREKLQLVCPHCQKAMRGVRLGTFSPTPVATCPACQASFVDRRVLEEILFGCG